MNERLIKTRLAKRQLGGAAKLTYTLNKNIEAERQDLEETIRVVASLREAIHHAMNKELVTANQGLLKAVDLIRRITACYHIHLEIPPFPTFVVSCKL